MRHVLHQIHGDAADHWSILAGASDGYKTAVLVQAVNGGPILAAYTD